jgi:ComF family protein
MVYDECSTSRRAWRLGYELLLKLQQILLPPRCIACGNPASWRLQETDCKPLAGLDLCNTCQTQLPVNVSVCRICALPLAGTAQGLICGRCLQRPPPYQASWCAFEYTYPITHLIRRLKYGGALAPARVLGVLLADYLRTYHEGPWPECFIPVPLHALRYRSRGYNQVIELGRYLEQALGIHMRTDLVSRIRHTPEQAGLPRRARRKNLRRAFAATDVVLPRHIAVLDDVITTGSTVNELANTLKNSGAEHIEVWGLARAKIMAKHSI